MARIAPYPFSPYQGTVSAIATLTGTPGAPATTYTLRVEPQPVPPATAIFVPLDRTQKFYAHLIGSDGSDTIVAAYWSTTQGIIDSDGVLTPGGGLDVYTVTAQAPGTAIVNVGTALTATVAVENICPPSPQPLDPQPPTILSVSQASQRNDDGSTTSFLVFGVAQATVTGSRPVTALKVYRGNVFGGPWSLQTDLEPISTYVVVNQLFDYRPDFGVEHYYVATAIDESGAESGPSNVVFYTASLVTLGLEPGSIYNRGPYPLLGCDVFIDPTTREGVIGPNGDLLTVNGLECLAQDLRLRILTEVGELRLHPNYGLSKSKVIGSGQAKPAVQAQIFRADIIDVLSAEPRVYKVLDVQISQFDEFSWIIAYSIMAINVEDVQHYNLVYDFYGPTATASA